MAELQLRERCRGILQMGRSCEKKWLWLDGRGERVLTVVYLY
jgi:hypothetical protein